MPVPNYNPSIDGTISSAAWQTSGNESNILILERRNKSANEPTGTRTIYLASGGTDPDGSALTKWTYTKGVGWTSEDIETDTSRSIITTAMKDLPTPNLSLPLTNAELSEINSYLIG